MQPSTRVLSRAGAQAGAERPTQAAAWPGSSQEWVGDWGGDQLASHSQT